MLRLAPKGQFARAFAQVSIGVASSGIIAAPLAAYFGALLSWRVVYAAAAVLAAIAAVLLQFSFPSLPASTDTRDRNLKSTLRLPGLIAGMVGVMLMFGGMQVFFGYLVPFLETVTRLSPTLVSVVLLLYGLSGLIGNLAAPRSLAISIPGTMMASTAIMAVLLAVLLPIGDLFVPTLIALMAWAFARMHVGVGVNSWVAHNFPEHVEQTSGILVAVIQFSMMIGAIIGGALIDALGAKAPATAAMLILSTGAVYISVAMKPAPSSNDPHGEALPAIAETQNIDASSGTFG